MKIITFYADCHLPEKARLKQQGFDWRRAIKWMRRSAEKQGYETLVVTDELTQIDAWLRVGDARKDGLMLWILKAQAAAIRNADGPCVMVSPDSLVMGSLDCLMGEWDLTLLTREKPKPIVNSVIGFKPSEKLYQLWQRFIEHADGLSEASREWGADIDAPVSYMNIEASESGVRVVDDVKTRFLPMESVFTSVNQRFYEDPKTPIWDFKGGRKRLMERYAR